MNKQDEGGKLFFKPNTGLMVKKPKLIRLLKRPFCDHIVLDNIGSVTSTYQWQCRFCDKKIKYLIDK